MVSLLPGALASCGSSNPSTGTTDSGGAGDSMTSADGPGGNDGGNPNDGAPHDSMAGGDTSAPHPESGTPESGTDGAAGGFGTIFTIILENTDYSSIVGGSMAPYLNSLIAQGGLATNYMDSMTHPSLPNYLYMVSGATQYGGFIDLDPTVSPFPVAADNLGNQMTTANIPWRSYQESAGGTCVLSAMGTYAPKHDPFLYFQDIQTNAALCAQTNVDYTNFAADLAAGTYKYMWITPNLNDDGHDTNLMTADTWCSTNIPPILNSTAFKNNGVLFITWDEGAGLFATGDHVPMIILSPKIKSAGFQSAMAYNHASFLATVETIFGLPKLGAAATAQNMMEFFQ